MNYKERAKEALKWASPSQNHALQVLLVAFDAKFSRAQTLDEGLHAVESRKEREEIHVELTQLGSEIEWAIYWIMLGDKSPRVGLLRNDDDGHNYLIPKRKAARFDQLMKEAAGPFHDDGDELENINCRIDSEFGDFRVDGIEEFDIIIPSEDGE